ncbi:murein transglycosylase [Intrasporangium sp. YIM S08009]|uniref:murein transglycosylase n=1 Tax=Intrasporangium zincisolvens TaxID=3080018 RepID=UPI002B05CA4E|nr:murein transglycosylase [Intrasporangium sp. YIM S08009]
MAGLVLGAAFFGASWLVGHGARAPVEQPATGSLVDVVDTSALTAPADRGTTERSSRAGAHGSTGGALVVQPDPQWVSRISARTGIPAVALRAYGRASILGAADLPDCHVGWTTLAAIGQVESAHGTVGGGRLLRSGRTSKPIVGPALDGQDGFAALRSDADGVRLHGDATWDHAVGPMQFLTSSWQRFGADADADGVADPADIDDAAWGAARHLCAGGADLRDGRAWTRAILGYNASDAYVRRVLDLAEGYARSAARR